MSELFNAQKAAQETIKAEFTNELVIVNDLIKKACSEGRYSTTARESYCPYSVRCLLNNAGYDVKYESGHYRISWNQAARSLAESEKELMEVAKEAGVELAKV